MNKIEKNYHISGKQESIKKDKMGMKALKNNICIKKSMLKHLIRKNEQKILELEETSRENIQAAQKKGKERGHGAEETLRK